MKKRAILDKYAEYLATVYPDWDIEVIHRRTTASGSVWGVIQMTKPTREPVLLRVHPWHGVEHVRSKGGRFYRTRTVLTKRQLQLYFGYAPTPRTEFFEAEIAFG